MMCLFGLRLFLREVLAVASKPLRPCKHPGCGALTRDGWCERHRPRYVRGESAEWRWMYRTKLWREVLRPGQLAREPWCRECAKAGRRVRATVVDHVAAHRGRWDVFCDAGNLQSLCKRCHDAKTLRERRGSGGV